MHGLLIFARCYLMRFWRNAVYIELMELIDLAMKQEIWPFSTVQLCITSFLKNIKWKFPFTKGKKYFLYYSCYIWSQNIKLEDQLYVSPFFVSNMYFISSCFLEWEKRIKMCKRYVERSNHMIKNEFVLYIYIRMFTI